MTTEQIVLLVLGIALVIAVAALVVTVWKYRSLRKREKAQKTYAEEVVVKDGERYSADPKIARDGQANVSHAEGDFVLAAGKTYRAEKDGELLPGTYTMLASSDASHAFKVRVGGYVRNFTHGDVLVLKDGEEICAVSGAVILR